MNSKKGAGKVSSTSAVGGNSSRGKGAEDPDSGKGNNVLNKGMPGLGLDSQENGWEVYAKKSKNRTGGASSKPWESSNTSSKPLGHVEGIPRQGWGTNVGVGRASGNNWAQASDYRRPGGRGIGKQQQPTKGWETQYVAPPAGPGVVPPLQHGWQWAARGGSSGSQPKIYGPVSQNQLQDGSFGGDFDSDDNIVTKQKDHDSDSDDDDLVDDSDGDLSDDYDSDASQKSHETRKKNRWFNGFFEELDKLTVEEINESNRQWHCPACQNAPGSIDWYKGLQPLMTHAKTKGSTRVKLHRELALLLEEELRRRGTTVVPAGEVFGKWKGLKETTDTEIIWPPMMVIMNTILEQDDNDKEQMTPMAWCNVASVEAVADGRRCTSPVGRRWRNNGAREGDSLTEDQVAPVVREGGHGASIIRVRGWSSGVSGRCEGATTVSRMADNTACMGQGAEKRGGDLRSRRQKADDGDGGEGREAVASKQRWRGRPCGQACACRKENGAGRDEY
ncbi:hypothetical protein ZIOFF_001647 [Zingiber officinale]|uniref:Zinc finger-XS domain-containing protein n=1 Tax=Zingiber officinale TaxID=94328 RepID=A0A8J5I613_ZINOF|nr:hypothetical protein ZIOFF_001647 [Zingiber officinale]